MDIYNANQKRKFQTQGKLLYFSGFQGLKMHRGIDCSQTDRNENFYGIFRTVRH